VDLFCRRQVPFPPFAESCCLRFRLRHSASTRQTPANMRQNEIRKARARPARVSMQVLAPAMCCPAVDCVVYVDFWRGDGLPSFPVFETFECVLIAFAPLRHEPTAFVRLLHPYIASVFRSFDSNDQVRSRIPEITTIRANSGYSDHEPITSITVRTFNSQSPSSWRTQDPTGRIGQHTPG
jgi:hypothetical protein